MYIYILSMDGHNTVFVQQKGMVHYVRAPCTRHYIVVYIYMGINTVTLQGFILDIR